MPRYRFVIALAGALMSPASPLATPPARAAEPTAGATLVRHPCGDAILRALSAHGVTTDRIAGVFVVNSIGGGRENTRLDGYDAWAQLAGRPGSVVARLDLRCVVREVYARDGATLPR